jgi:hypoxanthine-guanine phosphoribosyltransferase
LTLKKFLSLVNSAKPADVKVAVLVNRPDKKKDYKIDYIGLECTDFIVGCGLDFDQFGRSFPAIYQKFD